MVVLNGRRPSRWSYLRYQILAVLVGAVALPYLLQLLVFAPQVSLSQLNQTGIANTVGGLAGLWLFKNVTTYPGVEAGSYIIPSFTASYAAVAGVLVLGRLQYNRPMLLAGLIISLAIFFGLHLGIQRRHSLRIGVLPFGDTEAVWGMGGVEWEWLSSPDASTANIDAIAADLRSDLPSEWDRSLADHALNGVPVYHVKHLVESLTGRVELEHLSENSFGSLTPVSAYMTIKHTFDFLLALVALVVAFPALLMISLAVRLTSPGPAIFRQRRIGFRGQAFTVFKFRTMTHVQSCDGDARSHAMTKPNDERVTGLGRILRRTRLDELPQIINVIRGDMSWIGPRPEAEVLSDWYEAAIPFYRYRHIVRPGITGWAQVNQGHVSEVGDVQGKLFYDFYYIKNYSFWTDILIIARTASTLLTGFGSR